MPNKPVTKKPSTLVNSVVQTTVSTPTRRRGRPPKAAATPKTAAEVDPIEMLVDGYRQLQAEEKALMERKKDLAGQVKNFLLTLDDQKYTMKDGSYCVSLKVRPTWTYSDELTALINRLAADKKTEQQTGKATAVENVYVDGRTKA
mgnify:FL=1|tara:strand:+ start:958 stop:1395 length:438 start_codon:yes stop_codon:yes gene_type:complete